MWRGPRGFGYDFILFRIGQLSILAYALIELGAGVPGPNHFNRLPGRD
jgi:hypothetical protein